MNHHKCPKTIGFVSNKYYPSVKLGIYACISSRITTVIQVVRDYWIVYNWYNEPFAVSQYKAFILRHAWLNLWDERMTTGRIDQVAIFEFGECHTEYDICSFTRNTHIPYHLSSFFYQWVLSSFITRKTVADETVNAFFASTASQHTTLAFRSPCSYTSDEASTNNTWFHVLFQHVQTVRTCPSFLHGTEDQTQTT